MQYTKEYVLKDINLISVLRAISDFTVEHNKITGAETDDFMWMIRRWNIKISKSFYDTSGNIEVAGSISSIDRFFLTRDYKVIISSECVLEAKCELIAVDKAAFRPLRISKFFNYEGVQRLIDMDLIDEKNEISHNSRNFNLSDDYIDINNHVNNMVYINEMLKLRAGKISKLNISYKKQILIDEKVYIAFEYDKEEARFRFFSKEEDKAYGFIKYYEEG